jgi:putative membrane protein
MTDFLVAHYNLWRGLHIIGVIAWMAGIMYLPRLFAYHSKAAPGSEISDTFTVMEAKLLRIIMGPASGITLLFGLILIYVDGASRLGWSFLAAPWMLTKLAGIVFMFAWHGFLAASQKKFAAGQRPRSEKFWRATNELPFLAAVVMVIAVTTEFGL